MELSDIQKKRYTRQIILDELGEEGQKRLLAGSVLIIGAGGLGSPAAYYLAAAGVGRIGIVDRDKVELTNLNRQILHMTRDIDKHKVVSAKEKLNEFNPDVQVDIYEMTVDENNIGELIAGYDFVIDATDNFSSKFMINDGCVRGGKAFCHGGILGFKGQLMTYVPGEGPCYRCIFGDVPEEEGEPKPIGVIGAAPGVIGCLQAMEAIKYIAGIGELLTGRLLTYDGLKQTFRTVRLPNSVSGCKVCSEK